MAKRSYKAFAGEHEVDGRRGRRVFRIFYMDAIALRPLNLGIPPGHHARMHAGWYWRPTDYDGKGLRGPYTSSRAAYVAARERCPVRSHNDAA